MQPPPLALPFDPVTAALFRRGHGGGSGLDATARDPAATARDPAATGRDPAALGLRGRRGVRDRLRSRGIREVPEQPDLFRWQPDLLRWRPDLLRWRPDRSHLHAPVRIMRP